MKYKAILLFYVSLTAMVCRAQDFVVTRYGARPGHFNNTSAINKAIDACYKNGGGRVVIPAGTFKSGTLLLKDNVELHLAMGAVLSASTDIKDFPIQPQPSYRSQKDPGGWRALIYAHGITNIAITGQGTIDGNGAQQKPDPESRFKLDMDGRPRNLLFISCRQLRVEGISMRNSGIWNQHYLNCEDVIVDRIFVYNHSNRNNDGIDIDGCRRFVLSNAILDTDDDAIVLKSTGSAACENITITNCIVSSFCNAIKAGTESTGGFKNIAISNCIVKPSINKEAPIFGNPSGIAGLSLEIVDGGIMEGVSISNITIEGTQSPLYIRLGNRARKHTESAPQPGVGILKDVVISNIVAYNTGNFGASITAIPGHYIENISLSNIRFHNKGAVKAGDFTSDVHKIPEDEKGYPQPTVWKELPASALFIRHAKGIQVNGLMLGSKETDIRSPVVAVDVQGLQISNVAEVTNNNSPIFCEAYGSKNIHVDTPLNWNKKLIEYRD